MAQNPDPTLLDESPLSLDELAQCTQLSHEWIIEHVHAEVLVSDIDRSGQPDRWLFSGRDVLRIRRLQAVERDFDANPELAGLVADLVDELQRLRTRLRRAGISAD